MYMYTAVLLQSDTSRESQLLVLRIRRSVSGSIIKNNNDNNKEVIMQRLSGERLRYTIGKKA
jgi:hypothetical protein